MGIHPYFKNRYGDSLIAWLVIFSRHEILTDTTDSRILCLLINESKTVETAANYRRKLGWIIVTISLLAGTYKIATLIIPSFTLPDIALSIIGICFFLTMLFFYIYIFLSRNKTEKTAPYAD
jgi:hypothetical protein